MEGVGHSLTFDTRSSKPFAGADLRASWLGSIPVRPASPIGTRSQMAGPKPSPSIR